MERVTAVVPEYTTTPRYTTLPEYIWSPDLTTSPVYVLSPNLTTSPDGVTVTVTVQVEEVERGGGGRMSVWLWLAQRKWLPLELRRRCLRRELRRLSRCIEKEREALLADLTASACGKRDGGEA